MSNHGLARWTMIGGLLVIRHDSSRFTRDLDFSTTEQYQADTADQLLDEFGKGLTWKASLVTTPQSLPASPALICRGLGTFFQRA